MLGKTEADHLSGHQIILLVDTLIWQPVAEIENETAARNFEEQVEKICLADIGGPGLDLSGNRFCPD